KLSDLKRNPQRVEALRRSFVSYEQSNAFFRFFMSIFWSYDDSYRLLHSYDLNEKINALDLHLAGGQERTPSPLYVSGENSLSVLVSAVMEILEKLKRMDEFGEVLRGFSEASASLNRTSQNSPTPLLDTQGDDDHLKEIKEKIKS